MPSVPPLSRARLSLRRVGAAALSGGLLAVGLAAAPASAAGEEVRMAFNQSQGEMRAVSNLGSANTRQRIIRKNRGRVFVRDSFGAQGNAAGFPGSAPTRTGPRAAIAVLNAGSTDRMEPRSKTFTIGAQVRLGRINGSSVYDDGNNILQRGLYNDRSQFKIQIERGRATCRVKGAAGAVQVSSSVPIRKLQWYGIFCSRVSKAPVGEVRISVTPISERGRRGKTTTNVRSGRTGDLNFGTRVPLSVGAKVTGRLRIERASDQFNGKIDNAYLRIR